MFNNFLREGHGGLAAGSHTGNGIQDVLFEDTVMNHIDMAFRFKSAPTNGGFIANITMRDCAVADTQQAWVLTTSYSDPNSASTTELQKSENSTTLHRTMCPYTAYSIIPYRYLQMLIRSAIHRNHAYTQPLILPGYYLW